MQFKGAEGFLRLPLNFYFQYTPSLLLF